MLFLSFNSGLWYHYCGGIIPLWANLIATVIPLPSYILGSCSHYLGGTLLFSAYIRATVYPYLLINKTLCLHFSGTSSSKFTKNIAIVFLSLLILYVGLIL